MTWQPIKTAPKTSPETMIAIPFLAYCPNEETIDGKIRIVWWEPFRNKGQGCWCDDRDITGIPAPTHWMPLPEPPNV
jgi:hypothetical protein